jgi:hypothetical protein
MAIGICCATAACEHSRGSEQGPDSTPTLASTSNPEVASESSSVSAVATSEESSSTTDEYPISEFRINISYGPCEESLNGCNESLVLSADGNFGVHSDTSKYPIQDQVSVKLPPEEFDRLRKAAFVPELQERLNNPRACADEIVDFRATLMLQYRFGDPAQILGFQQDCIFADRTAVPEDDPVYLFYLEFRRLKEKYLSCPPWDNPGPIENFDLNHEMLPVHWLCYMCEGRCQVAGAPKINDPL